MPKGCTSTSSPAQKLGTVHIGRDIRLRYAIITEGDLILVLESVVLSEHSEHHDHKLSSMSQNIYGETRLATNLDRLERGQLQPILAMRRP